MTEEHDHGYCLYAENACYREAMNAVHEDELSAPTDVDDHLVQLGRPVPEPAKKRLPAPRQITLRPVPITAESVA